MPSWASEINRQIDSEPETWWCIRRIRDELEARRGRKPSHPCVRNYLEQGLAYQARNRRLVCLVGRNGSAFFKRFEAFRASIPERFLSTDGTLLTNIYIRDFLRAVGPALSANGQAGVINQQRLQEIRRYMSAQNDPSQNIPFSSPFGRRHVSIQGAIQSSTRTGPIDPEEVNVLENWSGTVEEINNRSNVRAARIVYELGSSMEEFLDPDLVPLFTDEDFLGLLKAHGDEIAERLRERSRSLRTLEEQFLLENQI